MHLLKHLFGQESSCCFTCGATLLPTTAPLLTGQAGAIVVTLRDVPVLRCPVGHEHYVPRWVHDDLLVAALVEEQLPTAIIRPLGAPLCSECGARLERAHVGHGARDYAITLGGGQVQQLRVTGPHVRCLHCETWQVYCANGGGLDRAVEDALRSDKIASVARTRQPN